MAVDNFAARLKQANLASKNDIANFVRKKKFDKELKSYNKKNYFKWNKTCTSWKWIRWAIRWI